MSDATSLTEQLRDLGLTPGAVVMVHASLRSLWRPPPRAEAVLAALQAAVSPGGTLLMLLAADEDDPFNPLETPVDVEDMGVLPEVFRTSDGVRVSDHPANRFGAWGPLAEHLLFPAPIHDYYGPGSTLERLIATDGLVLRLGANLDTVTLTHHAEYCATVPDKARVTRRYELEGGEVLSVDSLDDTDGIRQWAGGDYFSQILLDYLEAGHARTGLVGACRAELLTASHFHSYAVAWLERVFGGPTPPEPA